MPNIHEIIVIANRTCVLLASEDMITQRIDAHLARAKRATVSVGENLVDFKTLQKRSCRTPNKHVALLHLSDLLVWVLVHVSVHIMSACPHSVLS